MAVGRTAGARAWLACAIGAALLAPACTSGGAEAETEESVISGSAPATTETIEAEPTSVLPPSDFTANAKAFAVRLAWVAPPGEPAADRYTIYRDGEFVKNVDAPATSYTDDRVGPTTTYSYEIVARSGDLRSDGVVVEATTGKAPLKAARVAGIFNVRAKEISSSGYSRRGTPNYGWRFRPRCSAGACDVRWNDIGIRRARIGVVKRRGARYSGTYTGPFNVECSGTRMTSTVTIDFKVTAARVIQDEWRATRLVGTLNESEAAQLGCVSARAELEIRARLVLYP